MIRLIALAAILAVASALTYEEQWHQYKIEHGKSYKSLLEDRRRFSVFSAKMQEIEEHNEKFANSQTTFEMGLTRFSDWTEEEVNGFFRNIEIPSSELKSTSTCGKKSFGIKPPASADYRLKKLVTEVKDQGVCGSGWAFAAVAALETQLYFFSSGQLRSLSAQELVDCYGAKRNDEKNGCLEYNGTLAQAYDSMIEQGFALEADYPYVSGKSGASGECQISKITDHLREYNVLAKGDEAHMQEVVAFEAPVAVQIDGRLLTKYKSGIINEDASCSREVVNHAVVVIGYGTEEGVDFWILKNSWGTSWGEKGYFRVQRGANVCGVANAAIEPVFRC